MNSKFTAYLATFWSIISALYFFLATFTEVLNEHFADLILGFLLGSVVGVMMNFYYGSSEGSKEKDKK